jgi:hypothetical protein
MKKRYFNKTIKKNKNIKIFKGGKSNSDSGSGNPNGITPCWSGVPNILNGLACMKQAEFVPGTAKSITKINDISISDKQSLIPHKLDWMITDANHDKLIKLSAVTDPEQYNRTFLRAGDVQELIKFGFGTLSDTEFRKSLISKIQGKTPGVTGVYGANDPPVAYEDDNIIQVIIGEGSNSVEGAGVGLLPKYFYDPLSTNKWVKQTVLTKNGSKEAYIKFFPQEMCYSHPNFWVDIVTTMDKDVTTANFPSSPSEYTRDIFITVDAAAKVVYSSLALPDKTTAGGTLLGSEHIRIHTLYKARFF